MIAIILLKASADVPEYGDEVSSDADFKSVIRTILANQCSRRSIEAMGAVIDPELMDRLQQQATMAFGMMVTERWEMLIPNQKLN